MTEQDILAKIREMAAAGHSPPQIARELKLSRQWVYVMCARHSIAYPGRGKPLPMVMTGGVRMTVNSRVAGAIAEMLARGYAVYQPVLNSKGHDLIAVKDGKIVTIEVRSAWRNDDGVVKHAKPDSQSQIHAFVITGEPVQYNPPLG